MSSSADTINQLCHAQLGLVSRAQALSEGVHARVIDRLIASGTLVEVHRGVFRHAAVPETSINRLLASVLAAGADAVASHRSAAGLHELRSARLWKPELMSPAKDKPLISGAYVHRTKQLDREDVCVVKGVPATTVPRTLLDLGAVVPFETVERMAQDAIIRKLTTELHLVALLDRVGRRGRSGTGPLRAIVRQSLPDDRLQSQLERHLAELIVAAALPPPSPQHHVRLASGADVFLDFAWPARMLACEADGRRWHSTKADFERWLLRDRALKELGWDVRYFGWTDVVERRRATLHELTALLPLAA
jgi:very-short-patch-repair endonuclease